MALGSTIRNRIVGLLVIVSIVLIALPAMMDNDRVKRQENNEAIAIDKNGAIVDSDGDLMSNVEPDYATLLEDPKSDNKNEALPTLNNTNTNISAQSGSINDNTYVSDNLTSDSSGEILIGSVTQSQSVNTNNKTNSNTNSLGQNTKVTHKNAEVLTGNPEILGSKKTQNTLNTNANKPSKVNVSGNVSDVKAIAGKYSVQVGVFSQMDNASRVVKSLKAAGLHAYSQRVNVNGKSMVRVYAGSATSKEALNATLQKAQKVTGSKGSIVKVM